MENKLKAVEALQNIQQEIIAPKGQKNNFGNYNYRSCEDIFKAVKPLLKKYNSTLFVSDELVNVGDRFYIKATATFRFKDIEISTVGWAREELSKKGMDGSQVTGASSSYARKYALNGMFLIDDTKDSDSTNDGHANFPDSFESKVCDAFNEDAKEMRDKDNRKTLDELLKELISVDDEVKYNKLREKYKSFYNKMKKYDSGIQEEIECAFSEKREELGIEKV
jgi:hypothetical protein